MQLWVSMLVTDRIMKLCQAPTCTANVINIANTSNIGIAGMWAFHVNKAGKLECIKIP